MSETSNAKRGRQWEQTLVRSFATVKTCTVVKVEAPVRVVRYKAGHGKRHTGEFTGYFESRGACDFEGGYKNIPVSIEAKRTGQKRWHFGAIQDHQKIRMEQVYLMGGISGVLLAWDHPEGSTAMFGVDWATVRGWTEQGKASISPGDLMAVCDDPDSGVCKLQLVHARSGRGYRSACDLVPFLDSFVGGQQ